jgi:hypothetical protein
MNKQSSPESAVQSPRSNASTRGGPLSFLTRSYPKTSSSVKTWIPAFAGMTSPAPSSVMPAQAGIQGGV